MAEVVELKKKREEKEKAEKEAKKPDVLIYSTPTCPYCARAKAFMDSEGVKYKDFNVAEDAEARNEMIEKSGQMGVPVLDIKGKIIVGFDQEAIEKALDLGEEKKAA